MRTKIKASSFQNKHCYKNVYGNFQQFWCYKNLIDSQASMLIHGKFLLQLIFLYFLLKLVIENCTF